MWFGFYLYFPELGMERKEKNEKKKKGTHGLNSFPTFDRFRISISISFLLGYKNEKRTLNPNNLNMLNESNCSRNNTSK